MGFDELAAAGRAAVLSGEHRVESPPDTDARRWGPSVILRPDAETLSRTEQWAFEVLSLVGPGHWRTGSPASAHITVRALGPRRSNEWAEGCPARVTEAVAATVKAVNSVRFETGGVLLSPVSVMLALHPVDEAAAKLSASLEEALGEYGWFEKGRPRDIWYLNLVHFTGPITEPNGLAQWVTTRDGVVGLPVYAKTVEAVRWEFDGQKMVPRPLAAFPLDGFT